MSPSIAEILNPYEEAPELAERIARRKIKPPISISEPNAQWPKRYDEVKGRLQQALGDLIQDISHTGSTSVPGLPAKDIIDIDLSLKDIMDENSYVKPLEDAGFLFLLREPRWHQHRFFVEDWPDAYHVNLHVWGPDSPEVERHRIFRDWLRKTPTDAEIYANVKREAARQTAVTGDSMADYTNRKNETIQWILERAFRDLGYIE